MSEAASPLEGAESLCCFAASPTYHGGTASSLASPVAADVDPELASITTGQTVAATGASSSGEHEERERRLLRGVSMERAAGARVQVCTRGSHRPGQPPLLSLAAPQSATPCSAMARAASRCGT